MAEESKVTKAAERSSLRVLLIEDSVTAAEVVKRSLLASDLQDVSIGHVPSLQAAEPLLGEGWSVVLLDLGLPGCDDLDALTWVRDRAPELPVVVLTAHADPQLALRALRAEAQDYLIKGRIEPDLLARAIRYAIGRQDILMNLARSVEDARASESRLQHLTARSSDAIIVVDATGQALFANPAAEELFETSTLVGSRLPIDLATGEVRLARTHDERILDVRAAAVDWQGEAGSMAVIRDVTERRRADDLRAQLEQSERLAAIGQLAAGVAHEINNPLTYVTVNLDLALRELRSLSAKGHDTGTTIKRLEEAREGAGRVVRIVRDLSTFARVDPSTEISPVDLNRAVKSALKLASSQVKYRAVVGRDFGDIPKVLATEGRLSQVFLNIIVNAGQAIEEGHVADNRIDIRTFSRDGEVIVEVQDTGAGVSEQQRRRIFEPFFTTKRPGDGSGLGLSICRSIIEGFGGRVEVESELGVGTTMRVCLPAYQGEDPQLLADEHFELTPARRGKVLVVDDEPAILRALEAVLGPQHEVHTASCGEDARAVIERDSAFDLILCDVVMDKGTGVELYRYLASAHPRLARRVLFMTGGTITDETKAFLYQFVDRMVAKPFEPEEIRAHVARALAHPETA